MRATKYIVFAAAEGAGDPGDLVVDVVLRIAVAAGALQPAVTISPAASNGAAPADGEPGLTHMREALGRGIPVVTSNKWPVALHGAELATLARSQGAAFRAESTVMSGTPVLSALTEGLAGTVPVAL